MEITFSKLEPTGDFISKEESLEIKESVDAPEEAKEGKGVSGEDEGSAREGQEKKGGIEQIVKKGKKLLTHEEEKMIGHEEHLLLKNKYSDLEEQLKRLQAEFENFQKRTEKESKTNADSGKAALLRELLPILDEMEEAKKHTKDEGVLMVFTKLNDTLQSAGLREIDAEGFYDPSRHEVVGTKLSESEEGKVVDVMRKGYAMGDYVLRPSMVVISKK
jgi:molecular chaperone GrpE (heat shock protein)